MVVVRFRWPPVKINPASSAPLPPDPRVEHRNVCWSFLPSAFRGRASSCRYADCICANLPGIRRSSPLSSRYVAQESPCHFQCLLMAKTPRGPEGSCRVTASLDRGQDPFCRHVATNVQRVRRAEQEFTPGTKVRYRAFRVQQRRQGDGSCSIMRSSF